MHKKEIGVVERRYEDRINIRYLVRVNEERNNFKKWWN